MRIFNYSNYAEQKWDTEILSLISGINKYAGRQEMCMKQHPAELEQLVEIAIIQSTEASNAIEGIYSTQTRIKQLVQKKTTPKNRDEQEIAGYRDVLSVIHENYDIIPVTANYILQFHKMMYSHMNNTLAGKTKNVQNYISATYPDGHREIIFTPLAPYETPQALDDICVEYNRVTGSMEIDPLLAIPIFIHDFLCIHPFNDGNGRMSRLLTTLFLYKSGYFISRYISLEAKIADDKTNYYNALRQSQNGWHEGNDNQAAFIKYLLGTILAAYKDFDERYTIIADGHCALDMVRMAVNSKIGRFTKRDIMEMCPTLSVSSVEGALRKLTDDGTIIREGQGKSTRYYRTE